MTGIAGPKAFYQFAADYALDAIEIEDGRDLDDMDKLIDNALQYRADPGERIALRDFLASLLATDIPDEELQRLWQSSSARLAYDKETYRTFFAAIRDRLTP